MSCTEINFHLYLRQAISKSKTVCMRDRSENPLLTRFQNETAKIETDEPDRSFCEGHAQKIKRKHGNTNRKRKNDCRRLLFGW